jgi:hypothetical protein
MIEREAGRYYSVVAGTNNPAQANSKNDEWGRVSVFLIPGKMVPRQ